MNARKGLWTLVAVLAAAVAVTDAGAADAKPEKPLIQVAILLDNSGSMSGLINQARTQLWQMVNEFIRMKRDGMSPEIQVALYTYGTPPPKRLLDFTTDLDAVSEKLFAAGINGGSEYCGQVIGAAVDELAWSDRAGTLKVIFIAGNEPFTQGPVDFRQTCKAAISKGIVVNTIHCGSESAGISGKWNEGAALADGRYMCINQNVAAAPIAAPQDKELAQLSGELNSTYVPYGAQGKEGRANQVAQDSNAAGVAPGVAAERALSKSSGNYRNEMWDLVDAVTDGKVDLGKMDAKDLPEAMKKMTVEERTAHVESQRKRRAEVQAKIKELSAARRTHVEAEMKKQAEKGGDTLGAKMLEAVRTQAEKQGMKTDEAAK